jgi:hypothetical protein
LNYLTKLEFRNQKVESKDKIMYPLEVENYRQYFSIPNWYGHLVTFWKDF